MKLNLSSRFRLRLGAVILVFILTGSVFASIPKTLSVQAQPRSAIPAIRSIPAFLVTALTGEAASGQTDKKDAASAILHPLGNQRTLCFENDCSGIVEEMWEQINKEEALSDLRRLTGEEPICTAKGCYIINNRQTGSQGLQWAKDYIHENLVRLGYSVELQDWSRSGYADQNLIARKQGTIYPNEEIYFVAHLDGVSLAERSPAADDNASGAVDLLELARVMSNHAFSRTVVFLFSTGEEHGILGASSYVDKLSLEELGSIKYVINIDMVGYDADRDGVMQLWSGDHLPSLALAQMLSNIISTYQLNLKPSLVAGCT